MIARIAVLALLFAAVQGQGSVFVRSHGYANSDNSTVVGQPVAEAIYVSDVCSYRGISCNSWEQGYRYFRQGSILDKDGCYGRTACKTEGFEKEQECLDSC